MTDPVTYASITPKKGEYTVSARLQAKVKKDLDITFDLEGKSLTYYFGTDPNKASSVPYTILKRTGEVFTQGYEPQGKYNLGEVLTKLSASGIKWSKVDEYLAKHDLVPQTAGGSQETLATIAEDQLIEALLYGAGVAESDFQNYTILETAIKEIVADFPNRKAPEIKEYIETKASDKLAAAVLQDQRIQAALLAWVIAHPEEAAGIIATVKEHLPEGTIVIQFQEGDAAKVAVVVRQAGDGSWQIQGDKFSGYTFAIENKGDSRAFKVTPASDGATAIEATVVAGEIPAEKVAEEGATAGEGKAEPAPAGSTQTTAVKKEYHMLHWLLQTSGLLPAGTTIDEKGEFKVGTKTITLADGLSWKEAEALGFTRAAYNFFSTGGVVGIRGDGSITSDDVASVKKFHIDQVVTGLGTDESKGIVERYVKAGTYRIVPVNEAAAATLEEHEAGSKTIKASDLLGMVGEGNRESAGKLLWKMLGKTPPYERTSTFADTDTLDAATLARFYATLAFLAQLPESEEGLRNTYPLDTSKIDDLSLFVDHQNFLKWLKGEKVEKKEEAAGREDSASQNPQTAFADFIKKYCFPPGQGDKKLRLKTTLTEKEKAEAKKDLKQYFEKYLDLIDSENQANFNHLLEVSKGIEEGVETDLLKIVEEKAADTSISLKARLRSALLLLNTKQIALNLATSDQKPARKEALAESLKLAYNLSVEMLNDNSINENDRAWVSGELIQLIVGAIQAELDLSTLNLAQLPVDKMPEIILTGSKDPKGEAISGLLQIVYGFGMEKSQESNTPSDKQAAQKKDAIALFEVAKKILLLPTFNGTFSYSQGGTPPTTKTFTLQEVEDLIARLSDKETKRTDPRGTDQKKTDKPRPKKEAPKKDTSGELDLPTPVVLDSN